MSFVVYFFVLLIAAGSVLFGLDSLQAPMSPMPASKYELRAAKVPPLATPPARTAATAVEPVAKPVAQTATTPAVAVPTAPEPLAVVTPVATTAAAAPEQAKPKCDLEACVARYRSFDATDCTYQPNDGPRRLCTRGTPPGKAAQRTPQPGATPDARAQAACNVTACDRAYISFSAADCTYQPSDGPRRICTK